jgi:hypothetical protein
VSLFRDLFRRLRLSWGWVTAQFVGTALLILVGIAWTRLPEKHLWQVALSLLLPLLVAISVFELQAGTVRSLSDDDGKRVRLVWGAATLLVWVVLLWVCWAILDWCDDRIPLWAGYLNSRAPAHARARLFTYEHIQHWLGIAEWVLRWVVVPAKVIPYAMASAQWGWRLPWRRVLRLLWNWCWWLAVVLASLVAVWLPGKFFAGIPHGTVSAQVWHVTLKLAATYLLAVGSWILLLGWAAVLFGRQQPLEENGLEHDLFRRLRMSCGWIGALFGWAALSVLDDLFVERLSADQSWIKMLAALVLILLALILVAGTMRSLLSDEVKRVRMVWGVLSVLLWAVPALGIALLLSLWYTPIAPWIISWVVVPAILLPFAAASTVWGLRLPWRKILRVVCAWRWWLGLLAAAVVGVALPDLIDDAAQSGTAPTSLWNVALKEGVNGLLATGCWILLLGWLATLFGWTLPLAEEASVPVPAQPEPPEVSE